MKHHPWICSVCGRPVRDGHGYILIMDAATRGYPRHRTQTDEEANPQWAVARAKAEAEGSLFVLTGRDIFECKIPVPAIAFGVSHVKCDPNPGQDFGPYWIGVERARTLEEWSAWVLHLSGKTWLGKDDLGRLLGFWFANRGLELPHP